MHLLAAALAMKAVFAEHHCKSELPCMFQVEINMIFNSDPGGPHYSVLDAIVIISNCNPGGPKWKT